ncbi:hypothetical protein FPZ12_024160 [Amycolatopsis acidicola]|uniref:Uncharacterized protein n=1 Tax=Amycolatopsis acidicola TaxID=2596893 RepID=A0A5N0UWU4_9PSEU|nr:hypothetical protein FPZ12_024160 [Amycolatopsis acidicola]
MPDTRDPAVTSEFAELVYADPAWLRAEFDAIMTANFGVRPPRHPRPEPRASGPRRPRRHKHSLAPGGRTPPTAPTARGRRRQRAPPLPAPHTAEETQQRSRPRAS